jgi:hypothetical protein
MPGKPKHPFTSQILLIFLVTFFLLLSSGCGLDISFSKDLGDVSPLPTNTYQDIEFIAELSVPLQEDDSLALDMVDEIKGIPNNITRYNMSRMDDRHYHVIISVMVGSNVSYRYTRVGTIIQNEVTVAGNSVRYRFFHIGESTQVKDIISGWTVNDYPGLAGDLYGTIVEKGSGDPIADVLICIAGYQVLSDSLGRFSISNIPEGIHNFVSFAIDGSYQVFQQSIQIDHDLDTTLSIELIKLKDVTVRFILNSPSLDENSPIRIAGNLYQFGNTFADLNGGINLLASRMPIMTVISQGNFFFEIKLHAGNDLHYKYTLGDGFWNTEQGLGDIKGYRQLIVPKDDITIYDTIQSWQNDAFQSLRFSLTIPENTPSDDIISIQFGNESWFEPIPMVSSGNFHWDFNLLTPYPVNNNLNYRFCRNYICDLFAGAPEIISKDQLLTPGNNSIEVKLSNWPSWAPENSPPTIYVSEIPKKESGYLAGIEFLQEYHPSYLEIYLKTLKELKEKGITTIILHPSLSFELSNNKPLLYLDPRSDMLTHDIIEINSQVESLGMKLILSPRVSINSVQMLINSDNLSNSLEKSFQVNQYKEMLLSYAKLASNLNEENYIIDFSIYSNLSTQEINSGNFIENQPLVELSSLLSEVKTIFSGQVVCSIPLPILAALSSGLIGSCDAIYLQVDLAISQQALFENLKNQIGSILEDQIFPLYKSTLKPIYIGFSAPSITSERNDELNLTAGKIFSPKNSVSFSGDLDLEYQALIYNAFLNEIIGRDWIKGIVACDYYAPLKLTDASSSINGKPAMDVLWYWYTGVR